MRRLLCAVLGHDATVFVGIEEQHRFDENWPPGSAGGRPTPQTRVVKHLWCTRCHEPVEELGIVVPPEYSAVPPGADASGFYPEWAPLP